MAVNEERMRAAMLARAFAVQPICIAGNAGAALIVAMIAYAWPLEPKWWLWLAIHIGGTCAAFAIYFLFKRPWQQRLPGLAKLMLRLTAFGTGVVWCLGATWWQLGESETGLAVLLCISGLAAAGSSAWAADPPGLLLFSVPAFAPYGIVPLGGWWLGVLLMMFVGAITFMSFGNQRVLRAALALRWSNDALLQRAIHERHSAEEAQRRAEQAGEEKTRFLAAASHDLRQPVQALRLFVDALTEQPSEARRAEATEALDRTSKALSNMVESLLDLSRLDAGLVIGKTQATLLMPLLEDTAAALADEAEASDMVLRVAGAALSVGVDPVLLTRVVQNLTANAVRHAGRGRVLLSVRRRGAHALLQVWDQGPGIAAEDRVRVFEEFVQLGNGGRDRRKGLGLGLSMVKRICELCEWPISLRSEVGRGTVFSVLLPITDPGRRSSVSALPAQVPLRVILVDDDMSVRDALAGWLRDRGCTVHPFREASTAFGAFRDIVAGGDTIDVLVTDHGLPGTMAGAELSKALRAHRENLPTVVLTGAVEHPFGGEAPERALVLRKPASGPVIWEAIQLVTGRGPQV